MSRQPNIDPPLQDRPRAVPIPSAPARWRPDRPGMITAPDQLTVGGLFGRPGPDTGWVYRIVRQADLPGEERRAEEVLVTLMSARASLFGRAPIPEDLEVARILMGFEDGAPPSVVERRRRWLKQSRHESVPGAEAARETGAENLARSPADLRAQIADPR